MQRARQAVNWCYLCGEALPGRRRGTGVACEHVIPRALLGQPPSAGAWPITLDVHGNCDATRKRDRDLAIVATQDLYTRPEAEWNRQRLAALRLIPVEEPAFGAVNLQGLRGFDLLLSNVNSWVRACFAIVYNRPLPAGAQMFSMPPVTAWSSVAPPLFNVRINDLGVRFRQILMRMNERDEWDGITAWDGAATFRIAWWDTGRLGSQAIWAIEHPGSAQWASPISESSWPWHGWFAAPVPDGATVLGAEFFATPLGG